VTGNSSWGADRPPGAEKFAGYCTQGAIIQPEVKAYMATSSQSYGATRAGEDDGGTLGNPTSPATCRPWQGYSALPPWKARETDSFDLSCTGSGGSWSIGT